MTFINALELISLQTEVTPKFLNNIIVLESIFFHFNVISLSCCC